MRFYRAITHDLRCGLIKPRYLVVPVLGLLPCIRLYSILSVEGLKGNWIDYLLYMFKGMEPISILNYSEPVKLPMLWLLVVGSSLILHMDYFIHDLTTEGQQILVRGQSRRQWFGAKILWCFWGCIVYFALLISMTLIFSVILGAGVSSTNSLDITWLVYDLAAPMRLSGAECIMCVFVLPFLTVFAINIVQMVLCLFTKPIISYLVCMLFMVFAVYCNSPFALGNGAMLVRNEIFVENGYNISTAIAVCVGIAVMSIIVGYIKFRRYDILGVDE